MRYKKRLKFPCGYERETEIETILYIIEDDFNDDKCPLHGKKCKGIKK